ncbi:uncharacterized protein LOC144860372 [Branchiostoma floridae x Branchiostoma japonicum]
MTSLVKKLQNLELCLKSQDGEEVGYRQAMREAILDKDSFMEVEVLKSLGDLRLKKAKLSKDSVQTDKAAALYAAALLRCTDPDMGQTLEHRIGYVEKLSRQLLQGYTPHFRWLSPNYWRTADSNVLRVEEVCDKLDRSDKNTLEQNYTKTLVTAIENSDVVLELEVLKSLGDFYMEAAAMYKKALTRCGDPETRLAVEHRIRYTEKTREAVQRQTSWLAEKHFAAALKEVHTEDATAQQYQREVEPLCKLGDVYSKRGQQTGDGGDFVKAAALYNAAIARSEDQVLIDNIVTAVREVEKAFLKCILDINSNVSQDDTERHKKQLKEMRDQIKLEMETIDQQLDPYVHDEDDPCVREIEAKRAQAVMQLFEDIAQQRKEFISLLVEECTGLMGPPPCKYALIGLGSQATGLVTPYSDLEFAILVEEENEECLVYFRKLTHYLHLKVVNLGETILPALGIKSLNDLYSKNPLDNWYYDSVTPRGFAFDGSMPKASKTPLGRQGTKTEPASELICTPENMVSKLQQDATLYLKEGYHLATILRNPCLIAGYQNLIDTYMVNTMEILQADGSKLALQLAQETMKKSSTNKETITAKLIDVKKELYRFPALAVDFLALSSGIIPTTVGETIGKMENQQVISTNNAHHLTVLTSISAELRLRTYIANGGQKENLSAMVSMETSLHGQGSSLQTNDEVQSSSLTLVFHLPNEQQLFRYYYTVVPLKRVLQEWADNQSILNLQSDLYDNSPSVRGTMHLELCKYEEALSCYQKALEKAEGTGIEKRKLLHNTALAYQGMGDYRNGISYHEQVLQMERSVRGKSAAHPNIASSLGHMGSACSNLGDYKKAISYYEQALQIDRSICGQITEHPGIAASLNNLGTACINLGDYKKAINYHEQALQILMNVYGQNTAHLHIASSLGNLGGSWSHLGYCREAVSYQEQALQMKRTIYGQNTAHPDIATSLDNLGESWIRLGDYRKAMNYYEQALQMYRRVYGQTTTHPETATALNNLGSVWLHLGGYKKTISYCKQALQMFKSIHGQNTAHPDTVTSLNSLAGAWQHLGDYKKALEYYEQALPMFKSIYGQSTAHPKTAASLNNLGGVCQCIGDYTKALKYYEQALEMNRSIYGQSTAHSDIAGSLNNVGGVWRDLGDHRKAISYYDQALQMKRSIYGQSTAHPDIAILLNNLGESLSKLGDYRKAIGYLEQALEMFGTIYGQRTAHSLIATSFNNLGLAWSHLGDYRKALEYYKQALQMYKNIYGQSKSHPLIATSLNNLGTAWSYLGEFTKTLEYHEQALQMYRSIYGQGTAHSDIATSLIGLGGACSDLGDHRKGIMYYEQAQEIYRSIYGQTSRHPDIATLLNSLGLAWRHLGDYRKAIEYYEEALQMYRSIYGQGTAHSDIATSLNNLGEIWNHLGDYEKSISYCEQAMHMYWSIYGESTAHPDIAITLSNLGCAWPHLGDYGKAISYNEQALQMFRSIYGQGTTHPDIAMTLSNLGGVCCNLGDYSKALSLYQEALAMARQIYPQDQIHPQIQRCERTIVMICIYIYLQYIHPSTDN